MKKRVAQWFLLLAWVSLTICQTATAREQSDKTFRTVDDIAKLGVLVIDKSMNLVGVDWEDRGKWDVGENRIVKEIVAIGSKYGVNLTNYKGKILVGTRQGGGNLLGGAPLVYLELPDDWTEIVSFPDLPKLPVVKFKSGRVMLLLKQMVVKYSPETQCMINGKIFSRVDDKWAVKETSKLSDTQSPTPQPSIRSQKINVTGKWYGEAQDGISLTLTIVSDGNKTSVKKVGYSFPPAESKIEELSMDDDSSFGTTDGNELSLVMPLLSGFSGIGGWYNIQLSWTTEKTIIVTLTKSKEPSLEHMKKIVAKGTALIHKPEGSVLRDT
ncbi:MAG: hypothetical protein ABIF87_07280 [Pseudomonadota bacterium]